MCEVLGFLDKLALIGDIPGFGLYDYLSFNWCHGWHGLGIE
jgi:hypothetical protein